MLLASFALLAACGGPPAPPPPKVDPAFSDLAGLSLAELERREETVRGRDDLDAQDARALLELARRNRGPAAVSDDVSALPEADRAHELDLRHAWRRDHVAWSWDNLNPDAQMDPRPADLRLGWLVLAAHLPEARNGWTWTDGSEAWIDDYFQRKRWYVARDGKRVLSYMDQIQMQRVTTEVDALTPEDLDRYVASLPLPGMSPEEVILERELARTILESR